MTINECLQEYQKTGIRHFRINYFGVNYDVIIDPTSSFATLDWTITMRRVSPIGSVQDCEIWDQDLIKLLEENDQWQMV